MILNNKEKRIKRVRAKIFGTAERPRLAVFKSNRGITAQLIDDTTATTVGQVRGFAITDKIKPIQKAAKVGELVALLAKEKKIEAVVFDRRDKQYHGQVKALAEAARLKGLKI